ncbi:MAG: GDP-L-fucose synthase [Clostridiales bacterium]|nr:GDP-L-fucose synthase [Clostridiales bacterium]
MMDQNAKIYVAGHTGLVGSAFVRKLREQGYHNLVLRTHGELDLLDQAAVQSFFAQEQPEYVIDAAAKVGGIRANSEAPANFFYENMQMEQNLIWSAFQNHVKKFLFLGSACMYPKQCPQPMKEEMLLTGLPEITNEGYALAKVGGQRLCSYLHQQYGVDFITAIPANAYGIGDNFDPRHSHVIPALLVKYREAKRSNAPRVTLWGTGKALREFIDTDDLADAGIFLLNHYSGYEPVNIGTGEEVSILELSEMIKRITGFEGKIVTDPTKPDGMMRRLCDSSKIHELGWKSTLSLEQGIRKLYNWYLSNQNDKE